MDGVVDYTDSNNAQIFCNYRVMFRKMKDELAQTSFVTDGFQGCVDRCRFNVDGVCKPSKTMSVLLEQNADRSIVGCAAHYRWVKDDSRAWITLICSLL
jgi:hypothetical protein